MAGENDLISQILGDADPGDSGAQDEGGADDTDLHNQDDDQAGHEDDPDTGAVDDGDDDSNDAPADEDELAKNAREAREGKQSKQPKQQPNERVRRQDEASDVDAFDLKSKVVRAPNGDLYINKKLVARSGREARLFLNWRKVSQKDRADTIKMAQHITKIAHGAKELFARYDQLQKTKNLFEQAGLSATEQTDMLQLALAYKKDPVAGLKLMLTKAHMAGIDLKAITGTNGGIDAKAMMDEMKSMIASQLKPVVAATSERANQDGFGQSAVGFMSRVPRARLVAQVVGGGRRLGELLLEAHQRAPDLSIDELFQRLDYALLSNPATARKLATAPVDDVEDAPRRRNGRGPGKETRQNFNKAMRRGGVESFDDIARGVLDDIAAAESRGF